MFTNIFISRKREQTNFIVWYFKTPPCTISKHSMFGVCLVCCFIIASSNFDRAKVRSGYTKVCNLEWTSNFLSNERLNSRTYEYLSTILNPLKSKEKWLFGYSDIPWTLWHLCHLTCISCHILFFRLSFINDNL